MAGSGNARPQAAAPCWWARRLAAVMTPAAAAMLEYPPGTRLVLARPGPGGLDREEIGTDRGACARPAGEPRIPPERYRLTGTREVEPASKRGELYLCRHARRGCGPHYPRTNGPYGRLTGSRLRGKPTSTQVMGDETNQRSCPHERGTAVALYRGRGQSREDVDSGFSCAPPRPQSFPAGSATRGC